LKDSNKDAEHMCLDQYCSSVLLSALGQSVDHDTYTELVTGLVKGLSTAISGVDAGNVPGIQHFVLPVESCADNLVGFASCRAHWTADSGQSMGFFARSAIAVFA
jgi:hypothetical protein